MKLTGPVLLLVAAVAPNAWVQSWTPSSSSSSRVARSQRTALASCRRNFVQTVATTTVVGVTAVTVAAAAGVALPAAAAVAVASSAPTYTSTTTAMDLVQPQSLVGQVVVITGASTGLGLESAKALAQGGATVVLTARTPAKGDKALLQVQDYLQQQGIVNNEVYVVQLDLDQLDNVKTFPDRLQKTLSKNGDKPLVIDTLMNNAGVMAIPDRQLTSDGYERTFQSNHLGHFVLTAQLAPYLQKQAKVINVSSMAYNFAGGELKLDNLNGEQEYSAWGSYGQSKLENILFAQELQRRADAAGLDWTVTSLHPGGVNTDLGRNMMGGDDVWFAKKQVGPQNVWENLVNTAITKVTKTPAQGAATQVYLATTTTSSTTPQESQKGQFFSDLKVQKLPAYAKDVDKAKALWERSEELGGIQFQVPSPTTTTSTSSSTTTTTE